MTKTPLFSSTDWSSVRERRMRATYEEIERLDPDRLLNTTVDTALQYFIDKNEIEVPTLDRAELVIDPREETRSINDYGRNVNVKTIEIDVTVPFRGASDALGIRPSTFRMSAPQADVTSDALTFTVSSYQRNENQVKGAIDGTLNDIEHNLDNLRKDVAAFKRDIPALARDWIERRRAKLLADRNLIGSLGYKLKERAGTPRTYAPPEIRRKLTPRLAPKGAAPFKPEPALGFEDYSHILSIVRDMAIVMERSPSAFKALDEEALRFHFLVPLNGHYEGSATGETFNYQGKTDILIRVDGANIFIAECKFWSGPKKFTETIDQLLGYTSWRDTKTAIIIFNRNQDFSKVLETIKTTAEAHPNHVRTEAPGSETEFRYIFNHRDDAARELSLTILAFDVPTH